MMWCPMELGKVVVMTSQHPYCYRVHWCPGPDDEVRCPIVLGKVVGSGEDFSILLQCTGASHIEVSYGGGGMKDAGPIHCH